MRYRAFGRTGLRVSELGFGCGSVGGLLIRGQWQEMVATVERAIAVGVNYFDTASLYGEGRSEVNLGAVLQALEADVLIGTKVRLTPSEMDHLHDAVLASADASLKRLQVDCIDVLHLHNPIHLHRDPEQSAVGLEDLAPIVDAFQLLQTQGKVRWYGLNGLGETTALHHAVETAGAHSIQTCYNLLNPSAGQPVHPDFPFQDYRGLLSQAAQRGLGVIAIRVLAGGALSGTVQRHPTAVKTVAPIATSMDYAQDVAHAQRFQVLVEQGYTESLVEAAIRFAISNPAVSTALVGVSSLDQLEQAADAVAKGPLPAPALTQIAALELSDC
jgi:aryl-alcohol dehydrogenase-like predicted oxidoreductase